MKVAATGGHDGIIAHGFDFVRQDFWRGVSQRKNQWICRHAFDHVSFKNATRRESQKHVGAGNDVAQCSGVGFLCKENFVFVHQLGSAFIDHARQVGDVNVFTGDAQFDQQA